MYYICAAFSAYHLLLQKDMIGPATTKGSTGFANMNLLSAMKCQATFLGQILQPALLEKKQVGSFMHCLSCSWFAHCMVLLLNPKPGPKPNPDPSPGPGSCATG